MVGRLIIAKPADNVILFDIFILSREAFINHIKFGKKVNFWRLAVILNYERKSSKSLTFIM